MDRWRRSVTPNPRTLREYFNKRPPPPPSHELTVFRRLNVIAETFVQLYQQRQIADYDNARKWGRTDVLQKIDSVEAAFQSWHVIRNEPKRRLFSLPSS